jgi:hypothetical protein
MQTRLSCFPSLIYNVFNKTRLFESYSIGIFSRQLLELRNPYSISLADNSGKSGKRVYYDLKKETYGKRWAVVQRMTQTETD